MTANINRRTVAVGTVASLSSQMIRLAIGLLGIAILARILSPTEFGYMAMMTAFVNVAAVIGDAGLSLAAVQAKEVSQHQRANLFWISTGLGLVLASIIFLSAPAIAGFYGEETLIWPVRALALTFVFEGMYAQYRADLNRNLRFRSLAVIDISSALLSTVIGIGAAFAGLGLWALVLQTVTGSAVAFVMAALVLRQAPGLPNRKGSIRSFLSFGIATTLAHLVSYASYNVPNIAIGSTLGANAAGLYSRAHQLSMMPTRQLASPLIRVALPVFSRIYPSTDVFVRTAVRAQSMVSYPMTLALAFLVAASDPVISLMLGDQWSEATRIFEILVIAGLFETYSSVYYWLFLASGRMRVLLICESFGRIGGLLLLIPAVRLGLEAAAAAYVLGIVAMWLVSTFFGLPRIGVPPLQMVRATIMPFLLGVFMVLAIRLILDVGVAGMGDVVEIAIAGAVALGTVLLACAIPRVRTDLRDIIGMVRVRSKL